MDVKVAARELDLRPVSAFVHEVISAKSIEDALYVIGVAIAEGTPGRLALDLLHARPPAFRDVKSLIALDAPGTRDSWPRRQGPRPRHPGTSGDGQNSSGGVMICDLVAAGKRVGVTALSHAAIANLLKAVRKESARPERQCA